jgi:hypothetical protein
MARKDPWAPNKKWGRCPRLGRDHSINDKRSVGPDAYCVHCNAKWDDLEKGKK